MWRSCLAGNERNSSAVVSRWLRMEELYQALIRCAALSSLEMAQELLECRGVNAEADDCFVNAGSRLWSIHGKAANSASVHGKFRRHRETSALGLHEPTR